MQLTFGSLFAGVGGFDLGFERSGMRCVWQVEMNDYANRVLAKHWPDVRRWDDVRTFPPADMGFERPDVICGGFPCQDISNAGKQAGIDGERSGLWGEMLRIVRDMEPRFVVIENVSALLVRGIERVLSDLASIGFDAEWEVLPASAFGCYHERSRLFILAYHQSEYGDARGLLEACEDGRSQIQFGRLRRMVDATERRERNIRFEHEPDVARMVDGIPNRTHRIECLGNAIVPSIAEWIGRRIVEAASATPKQ